MRLLILISLILSASLLVTAKVSYQGYKLVRVVVDNHDDVQLLSSFENYDMDYDVWGIEKEDDKWAVVIMLSPKSLQKYMNLFRGLKTARVEIINDNVQEMLDVQEKELALNRQSQARNPIINKYARTSEINNFLLDVVEKNPTIASIYSAGKSFRGQDLKVLVFKTQTSRRGIWIDCTVHAREWVSPASCVYIIDQIAKGYQNNDNQVLDILNKYEVHILTLVNPDGYDYSFDSDRLWRKNRRDNNSTCVGVDINRNADYRWNTGGASNSPCSLTFAGPRPNSEPETMAIVNSISNRDGFWDAYYTIHSYGNWWLLPWGHSTTEKPPNNADLIANANIAVAAIKAVNGQDFIAGSTAELLYIATGTTGDWAYGAKNIPFTITLELRPKTPKPDISGFVVPEEELPEITAETWAGVKASILDISTRLP